VVEEEVEVQVEVGVVEKVVKEEIELRVVEEEGSKVEPIVWMRMMSLLHKMY
jgi:hypothetical protein